MNHKRFFTSAAPLVALLFGLQGAACDGSSTNQTTSSGAGGSTSNGGAGGEVNTGENGGAGGAGGGMMIAACSAEQGMVAAASWPWFGFEQNLPDPKPDLNNGAAATVSAIELGGLRLTFEGAASDVRLAWSGPDLKQIFAAGDMVTVTTDAGLQAYRVTGAKGQAVVLRYANATVPAMIPNIPGGGPNLTLEEECVFEQVKTCPQAERRILYRLNASLNGVNATIASGMTGTVGTWQIGHIKSMNLEFYSGMECLPEKFFDGAVHALEVKP
jgi:hypothetical protein